MQPLIIIGMHRSGTSLIVRLLKDLGIHMGTWLSRDAEAVHFQKINRRIFDSVGSKWGDIDALVSGIGSEVFIQKQTDLVLNTLFPRHTVLNLNAGIVDYFGQDLWKALAEGESIFWGWKDPRTTITFPIWLRVFPQARYLHVLRNGIDVAISTHRRSQKQRQKAWKRIYPLDYSPVTLDFEYCFRLWEKHITFVLDNKSLFPPGRYLELCYEDLLANPEEKLKMISNFIEYPVQDDMLKDICGQINRGRLNNTEYARPYQGKIRRLALSPLMQQLGYSYRFRETDKGEESEH
jgi:hypothetical protein